MKTLMSSVAIGALVIGTSMAVAQSNHTNPGGSPDRGMSQGAVQGPTQNSNNQAEENRSKKPGITENQKGRGNQRAGQSTTGSKTDRQMGQRNLEKGEHPGIRAQDTNQPTGKSDQNVDRDKSRKSERAGQKNEDRTNQQTEERNQQRGTDRVQKDEKSRERAGQAPQPQNERAGQRLEERGAGHSVTLSSDQRTKIHDVIIHDRVGRVDHVEFPLTIGTRIPESIRLYDLPTDVVSIVPQYRGFKYIIVRDELVILDPDTLEIVAVLPA